MKKTKFIAAALAVLFVFNTYAIPRSKAVVIDATAAFGAAAATAAINGTTATTLFTGMSTSAATSAMTTLMGEYVAATGVAASGAALASTIASGILVTGGVLLVGAAAAALIGGFLDWLQTKKGVIAGGDIVSVYSGHFIYDVDGVAVLSEAGNTYPEFMPYILEYGRTYTLSNGTTIKGEIADNGAYANQVKVTITNSAGSSKSVHSRYAVHVATDNALGYCLTYFDTMSNGTCYVYYAYTSGSTAQSASTGTYFSSVKSYLGTYPERTLSLDPRDDFESIPQDIPEGQVLKIDTGLETLPADDQQAAADAIIQTAIDGVLDPIVSVENDPTVTPDPDPDPEPVPPPEDLPQNLPELGDVLISRFPFSIPWDIGRVLDFLSAEPVAPHIDFQPFKGDLFGIPAGSVSVDYDFSKHEDIAAFCRTFEIVGFCLLLAVGTKRLIWTA